MALLELAKEHLIEIVQEQSLGPIYLRSAASPDRAAAEPDAVPDGPHAA